VRIAVKAPLRRAAGCRAPRRLPSGRPSSGWRPPSTCRRHRPSNWTWTWTQPAVGPVEPSRTLVEGPATAVGNTSTPGKGPQVPFTTTNLLPPGPHRPRDGRCPPPSRLSPSTSPPVVGHHRRPATDNIGVGGVRLTITNSAKPQPGPDRVGRRAGAAVDATFWRPPAPRQRDGATPSTPPVAGTYNGDPPRPRDTGGLADNTPAGPVSFGRHRQCCPTRWRPTPPSPSRPTTRCSPLSGATFHRQRHRQHRRGRRQGGHPETARRLKWWNGSAWVNATALAPPGRCSPTRGAPVTGLVVSRGPAPAAGVYFRDGAGRGTPSPTPDATPPRG